MTIEEIIKKQKEHLTKAQIGELIQATERYKQLNSANRASAMRTLSDQYRATRRGLQNTGLAGRKGKLVSGQEKAARIRANEAYRSYNAGLRQIDNAYAQNRAARMSYQNAQANQLAETERIQAENDKEVARINAEYESWLRKKKAAEDEYKRRQKEIERLRAQQQAQQQQIRERIEEDRTEQSGVVQGSRIQRLAKDKHPQLETSDYARAAQEQAVQRAANEYQQTQKVFRQQREADAMYDAMHPGSAITRAPHTDDYVIEQKRVENARQLKVSGASDAEVWFADAYGVSPNRYKTVKNENPELIKELTGAVQDLRTKNYDTIINTPGNIYDKHNAREAKARDESAISRAAVAMSIESNEMRNLYLMNDAQFEIARAAAAAMLAAAQKKEQSTRGDTYRYAESDYYNGIPTSENPAAQEEVKRATERLAMFDAVAEMRSQTSDKALYYDGYQTDVKTKDAQTVTEFVDINQADSRKPYKWANVGDAYGYNWENAVKNGWSAWDYIEKDPNANLSHVPFTDEIKEYKEQHPNTTDEEARRIVANRHSNDPERTGSLYAALVNDWSYVSGRTWRLYSQYGRYGSIGWEDEGGTNRRGYYDYVRNSCTQAFFGYNATHEDYEQMDTMLSLANLMTDEERARFNELAYVSYGVYANEADEYFEYLYKNVLPDRFRSYVDEKNGKFTDTTGMKVMQSILSVPNNIVEGITGPIHTLTTNYNDSVSAQLGAMKYTTAQAARESVSKDFSPVGKFFYDTGMSMADSASVAMISGGIGKALQGAGVGVKLATKAGSVLGGSILGGSAFNSAYKEALDRGLSPDKARTVAVGQGFNEMLFESLSLDLLVSQFQKGGILKVSKNSFVNWFVNTLVQGGVEGSEEVFTDLANNLWDKHINGIYSEELTKLREYIAQGMSYEEAKRKVADEFSEQLGMSFLGGALSGGIMGGGASFLGMVQNRGFERYGAKMDADAKAEVRGFNFKDEQMQELAKQSKLTNQDYGVLAAAMLQQRFEEGRTYVQNALKDGTITKEQKELYDKYAQMAKDGKLTADVVASDEYAQDMEKLEPVFDIMDEGELIQQGMRDLAEAQRAVRDENAKYDKQVAAIENDTTLTDEQKQQKLDAIENERGEKVVEKVRDLEKVQKKYDENVKAENGKVETMRGNLTYDFSTAKTFDEMSDRQKSAIRFAKLFADKYGMNIKVVDDSVAGERVDGEYNSKTNTITVNISGSNSVMYTVSHEITHWLQRNQSKAYNTLKSAIEKELSRTDLLVSELPKVYQDIMGDYKTEDNTVMEALVKYEQDMYKRQTGETLSKELAGDEVVARCCESFLKDRGFAQKMVAENPGTARTIAAKLRQLANDMKTLNEDALERGYEKYGELIDSSIEKAALEQIGDIEKIARMWENALNQAAKKAAKDKAKLRADTKAQIEGTQYSRVNKQMAQKLDNEEQVKVYRAMQVIDGKLYPPMAAKVKSEDGKTALVEPTEIGQWYQSDERPDLINPKTGKWKLNKGNGTALEAAYNPYFHTSTSPLNDQFSSAYKRPNLVVVEGSVPKSELTSGYKAQYAKDSVGAMRWHSGTVSAKLKTPRTVILSRYFKVNRILSDAEVASKIKTMLEGENVSIPQQLVTPGLYNALNEAGVKTTPMEGVQYSTNNKDSAGNALSDNQVEYFKDSKARDKDGNLMLFYHGTNADFTVFDRSKIGSTGRFEGSGFNFTPYEGRAKSYGKNVLTGYLNITHPLSADKKTLTVSKLAQLIREVDPTGDNIIANYANDTRDYGSDTFIRRESINTARNILQYSDNDVDVYSDISSADPDAEGLIAAFEKLGYDGVIHYDDNGRIKTAVVFSSNQFKNADNKNPTKNDDVRYSLNNKVAGMNLPSLSINDSTQAFTQQILDGEKDIETRTQPIPNSIVGKWIPIIRTGKGTQTVVGYVKFSGDKVYNNAKEFDADYKYHLVGKDSPYYKDGKKYGWIISDVVKLDKPIEIGTKGYKPGDFTFRDLDGIIDDPNASNLSQKAKAKFISKLYDRNGYARHLTYRYRGREYMITDENNGYSEPMSVKHKNEQERIDREIEELVKERREGRKEQKYEGSAQEGFDLFWDYVENGEDRFSMNDKDFVLKKNNGEKWYELRDAKAKLYGSSVELEGGSLLNRVRMMQNLAEMYGSVTVDATSEKEAEAFKRAGAKQETDAFSNAEYGTWEFTHTENKYEQDTRYDAKQKRNFANAVLKEIGTFRNFKKEDLRIIRARLEKAFAVLHNAWHGDGDQLVAMEYADKLFDQMLNRYTEMSEADADTRDALLAEMPVKRDARGREYREIEVTATQIAEIKNQHTVAEFNAALSKALGTRVVVKQTENAKTLEDVFKDNPYLDATTNEGDMPMELLKKAQETVGKRTNPYKAESEERAALKEAVYEKALDIVGIEKSTAQKVREAVKQVRAEERAKAKTKLQTEVEKARLAERMHEGAIRAKDRRASAEREMNIKRDAARREAKLKDVTKQKLEQQKLNTLRRDVKTVALRWNQRLVKMLANPTEASHVPVQLAREVAELTKTITEYLDSGTQRGQINLEKIAKAYQQAFDDQATIAQAKAENPKYDPRGTVLDREMYDEQLVGMINELNTILQGKSLKDLNPFEMRMLFNTVRGVAHTVYEANRMIGTTERKAIWQVGDKMVSELENAPKVSSKLRGYLETSLDLRRLAKIFSGSNENAEFVKLVDQLNKGAIEKERIAQTLQNIFKPVTDQYGEEIRKWYGKKAEWIDTGIRKNGKKVEITKGMRVSLALHVLNEGNMAHIRNGGLTIPSRELYNKGRLKDAYADKSNRLIVQLTEEQIDEIISHMTDAEKAYVKAAKELFHSRAGYFINRTALQAVGYRKAMVENYFPIHTNKNYTYEDWTKAIMENAGVENQGFLQERKDATNPIYLEDITSVVNRQINGVALYAALAVPLRNWKAVMNSQIWHEQDGVWQRRTSVKETIISEMGSYGDKVLHDFINDVSEMSHVDVTPMERFAGRLATNYVKAVLLGNLKVAMKQVASYPTAAAVIPWKYLGKALLAGGKNHRIISRADVDLINQYTPLYQMRREGQANEIASIMAKRGMEQKLPWLLGWITKMDVMTVGRLWSAAEYMVADQQKNLPVGSDEYYKAVAKVFNDTIQQTQPNFTPLQRNAALRSKNPVVRSLVLFGTQRMQNGGILMEAAMELKQSKGKSKAEIKAAKMKLGRAVASQIVQNILLIVASLGVDALRGRMKSWQDDDKEITPESMAKNMGDMFLSNFIGSFLGGSETYSLFSGLFKKAIGETAYDTEFTVPALDAIETLINFAQSDVPSTIKYLLGDHTDEEKQKKAINFSYQLAKAFGYATGIPLENALKDVFKGIIPAIEDISDAIKTGELNLWLHQSGKLDKKTTNANYKEWTNNGFKGSEYFYWENVLTAYGKREEKIPILLEADLPNEKKAMLLRMMDKSGATSEGTVVYKSNGDVLIDFANPTEKQQALPMPTAETEETATPTTTPTATPKPTENPLTDARQEGVREAVAKGVPEQTAFDAFLAYQNMGKNKSDDYSRNDDFRAWLFTNVKKPEDRAILEYQVIGAASKVEGAVTYRESGVVYRDYTNEAWFRLSEHNLSKDGTNKRYEAGKRLEKTGLSVDKTVAIYDALAEYTKKAEWTEYLKKQGLTEEQINIFLWSRGWAK